MALYIIVALWPLLIELLYNFNNSRSKSTAVSKKIHILLALIPMFVLIALRSEYIGADTYDYLKYFKLSVNMTIPEMCERFRLEEGYIVFINFLSTFITKNPLVYQIIYTSIYLVCIWDFCCQMEDNDAFLFAFFYATLGLYTFMFTGVRQCIAMSLCLVSYRFVRKKKIIPFLLIIALAFTFHKTAFLFSIVYFISGRKLSLPMFCVYGAGAYIVHLFFFELHDWFSDTFEYNYEAEVMDNGLLFLALLLLFTVFSLIMLWDAKKLSDRNAKAYLNINFMTILFWLFRQQERMSERLSYFFLFFSCAMIAHALGKVRDRQLYFIAKVVIIAVCIILYIYRLSTNFSTFVPYRIYGQ